MCCGNKKKVVTSQVNQPVAVSGVQQPTNVVVKPATSNINNVVVAPSSVPVIASGSNIGAASQLGRSKLIDKTL